MQAPEPGVLVAGAGSWGTALAVLLSGKGVPCVLWGHTAAQMAQLAAERENREYLPGVPFPSDLGLSDDLAADARRAGQILIAVPSHAFAAVAQTLAPLLSPATPVVWATKGFDHVTARPLHQVAEDIIGNQRPLAVISGPSFAKEVAMGQPTAVTVAANNADYAQQVAELFHTDTFRVYTSDDLTGVQTGGATKNVIAIAAGIADGLGFGANARAALITRGLPDCMRLGVALGGKAETFMGLAGLGDLVLTCTDNQSRNRRFGYALGQGKTARETYTAIGQVVEGAYAVEQVTALARRLNLEMPISEQVRRVLAEECTPMEAVQALLARELKQEY